MDLIDEVRQTLRALLKAPAHSAAVVITLALAMGANSAIFAAVYAVLMKPLPIREPGQLVVCWETDPSRNQTVVEISYRTFEAWRAANRSFVQAAAVGSSTWPVVLEGRGDPVRLASAGVTASFFQTLDVRPLLGRLLQPEDDQPNAPPVVVLSHRIWVERFGSDPAIVGASATLDDSPATIVGVMPQGFDFPRGADVWVPVVPVLSASSQRWGTDALNDVGVLFIIGRLRDGVTAKMAQEELDLVARRVAESGTERFGTAVSVTPFLDYFLGPVRLALWSLFIAVALLLLVACANVSGLLLTRMMLRQREQAIRLALGASEATLRRQSLVESVLLSLAAGVAGLAGARWIVGAILRLAPDDVPRLHEVSVDSTVAAFACLATLAAALLSAAAPAVHVSATTLMSALNDAARGTGGRRSLRARSLLVRLQIAMAVVLLAAAGLLVRSYANLRQLDLGFDPANVVTVDLEPRLTTARPNEWIRDLITRVEELPDVEAVGGVYLPPLALGAIGADTLVLLEGQPDTSQSRQQNPSLSYQSATPGYFDAMRITLMRGRLFDRDDHAKSPRVVIISESTARRLWPDENPIGRRLSMPSFIPEVSEWVWRTVVGVVTDVRYRGLDDVRLDVYEPALQSPMLAGHLMVRTSANPVAVATAVQAQARRLDPRVLVGGITTMDAVVSRALAPWRLSVWMFSLFGVVAFVLATVGLFSVVALEAQQRCKEFAVRIALGAQARDIGQRVLKGAGSRVLVGGSAGLLIAAAGAQLLARLLFRVDPLDPLTYLIVIGLVAAAVVGACSLPAYRAVRIDPAELLKRK